MQAGSPTLLWKESNKLASGVDPVVTVAANCSGGVVGKRRPLLHQEAWVQGSLNRGTERRRKKFPTPGSQAIFQWFF